MAITEKGKAAARAAQLFLSQIGAIVHRRGQAAAPLQVLADIYRPVGERIATALEASDEQLLEQALLPLPGTDREYDMIGLAPSRFPEFLMARENLLTHLVAFYEEINGGPPGKA